MKRQTAVRLFVCLLVLVAAGPVWAQPKRYARDPKQPVVIYCSGGDCEDSHMLAQKLFLELGLITLAVGIALVVLIPLLRKLITDKAETIPEQVPTTVVPAT